MKKVFLYILIVWGLFWIFAFFAHLSDSGFEPLVDIAMLIIFALVPILVSLWQLRLEHKKKMAMGAEKQEQEILQLARKYQGLLTVMDVAEKTRLSMDESKALLDEYVKKGYADYQVGDGGAIQYQFFFN